MIDDDGQAWLIGGASRDQDEVVEAPVRSGRMIGDEQTVVWRMMTKVDTNEARAADSVGTETITFHSILHSIVNHLNALAAVTNIQLESLVLRHAFLCTLQQKSEVMYAAIVSWLTPKRPRILIVILTLLFVFVLLQRVGPAIGYYVDIEPHPRLKDVGECVEQKNSQGLSVNLVVASTSREDISWTRAINIPGLNVIRYVSDSPSAQYHPPVARGREALMYFTYLNDFYDSLPDVSIFVHADETPWHLEGTLLQNTTFALSQLDLQQVLKRAYFNLRVTWRAGCPAWINTTKTMDDWNIIEEPYMKEAWRANFGPGADLPEILAGPCCSQFAVSRDAIRRNPQAQYRKSMDWLIGTDLTDHMSGRVWEHMWPWLFKNESKDCAPELSSLCDVYRLCFRDEHEVNDYKELWEDRERLKEDMSFFRAILDPSKAAHARLQMVNNRKDIEMKIREVWMRHGCKDAHKAG